MLRPLRSRARAAHRLAGLPLLTLVLLASLAVFVSATSFAGAQERPTVNAREFPSIQAAVQSLPPEGGVVVVPAGVYDVHEKIRLPSHVELRGAGIDRTILVLADGARDHLISNADLVDGNTDITIRDLQLQGNRSGQRVWRYDGRLAGGRSEVWSFGVRLVNVTDSLIANVEASGFTKDGFYLGYNGYNGVYRTRLINCRARENGRNGISLTHGSYNLIQGCVIRNNNQTERVAGIDLEPDGGLEVSFNQVIDNQVVGHHNGISLWIEPPSWRGYTTLTRNAVCYNLSERNSFAGIADHFGRENIFVDNVADGAEVDFGPAPTALIGPQYAAACQPRDIEN